MPKEMSAFEFILGTVFYVLMGAFVYYLLVTKPSIEKENKQQKFLSGLKRGDEVRTSGGIFGKVLQVAADHILLEISQGVKIKIHPLHVHPVSETDLNQQQTAASDKKDKK